MARLGRAFPIPRFLQRKLGDAPPDAVVEAIAAADSQTVLATFESAITETLSVTDSPVAVAEFSSAIAESLSAADSQDAGLNFVADVTDALSAADAQTVTATFSSEITEALSAADAQSVVANFVVDQAETLSAADVQTCTCTFSASITESLTASDSTTGLADFTATATEVLAASEVAYATADFAAVITESLNVSDSCDASVASSSVPESSGGGRWFWLFPRKPKRKTKPEEPIFTGTGYMHKRALRCHGVGRVQTPEERLKQKRRNEETAIKLILAFEEEWDRQAWQDGNFTIKVSQPGALNSVSVEALQAELEKRLAGATK